MSEGFIVEHPTKGVLMDETWDGDRWKGRWSWSKPRSAGMRIEQEAKARELAKKYRAQVRRWGDWEVVS